MGRKLLTRKCSRRLLSLADLGVMCKPMTKSEENTKKFFQSVGIDIQKVSEGSEKTPDYHFSVNGVSIYLEVKEITENDKEKIIQQKICDVGEAGCYDSSPIGKRFRSKISEANRQLRNLCVNGEPGIVLIQDSRPFATKSLMPQEEIKQAMFGDRVIWRTIPSHLSNYISKVTADIFSHNKTTTEEKNTTISAVGLLIEHIETGELSLLIHHNPYAKNPLPVSLINNSCFKEYKIDSTKEYGDFIEA